MKKFTVLALLMVFGISASFAQFIEEGIQLMSQGSYNSLSMELPKTGQKDVQKAWEKFASKTLKGKTKYDKKSGEIFTDNAKYKSLSNNDFDVYARVVASGTSSIITVWYDLGGAFLHSEQHPAEFKVVEKQLYEFALIVARDMLEDEIKAEEKAMKKLESDLKKLGKEKEGYEQDIEKAKETIIAREKDIDQNFVEQGVKQDEIGAQKNTIEALKDKLSDLN